MAEQKNRGYNLFIVFKKVFNRAEESLLAYSIVTMAVITVAQIITRTFFHFGFGFVEQVGGHTLVMVTFLGASIAVKQDKHFRMGALVENLPNKPRRMLGVIVNLGCALFFLIIVYQGVFQTLTLYNYGTKTSALSMPFFLVYIPIPLFSIGISIRYGIAAYKDSVALMDMGMKDP
jgi:C4-dicarboxylate transporter DctQ subunit